MLCTEHIQIDAAYRDRLRAGGLDTVRSILAQVTGQFVAWSRTTDTLYVPGERGVPGFFVKRYLFPNWVKRFRGTLRGTFFGLHRGEAEYRALDTLRLAGIPAVRPVACGGQRLLHVLTACFLITEEVPDAQNLTSFALDVAVGRRALRRAQRHALVRTLAEQVAAMHATGCSHGNLFWRNVLVRSAPDGRPEFFFLDAQPLRSWQRFGANGAWWERELAQLAVSAQPFTSRSERCRFLRTYLGLRKLTAEGRSYARRIDALARTWRRHEDRRIRMNRLFDEWSRRLPEEAQTCAGRAAPAEPAP